MKEIFCTTAHAGLHDNELADSTAKDAGRGLTRVKIPQFLRQILNVA